MSAACLLVRAGDRCAGLPIRAVVETMRPLPAIVVPGLPSFVMGIAVIRGAPTPVVDLVRLFGDTPAEPARRYVVVRAGDRRAALAVSAVLGIEEIDASVFSSAEALTAGEGGGFIAAIAAKEGSLFTLLDPAHVLPEGAWSAIEGEARRASA